MRLKKLYYVPGFVSLLILPLIFICYSNDRIKRLEPYALKILWFDSSVFKLWERMGYETPTRHNGSINLTGAPTEQVKHQYFQVAVREILCTKDTVNGIKVHFTDSSTYGVLIGVLDILKVERSIHYLPLNDDVYFLYMTPKSKDTTNEIPIINCGTHSMKPQKSSWLQIQRVNTSRQLIIGFMYYL
jgi:hypothetical protein